MDKDFERVLFSYLDSQDFIQIDMGNDKICFVNSENDKYAQIRFDKDDGYCFINFDLVKEISSFFSLQRSDSQEVIGRWVENTIQMKVTNTFPYRKYNLCKVENTLQMKVTNTSANASANEVLLRIPN